jgi:hypothetical protein
LVTTLAPGVYTTIVRGKNNTSGIGLAEIYDIDSKVTSKLGNISSRGFVQTGDNVMIGGFIVGPNSAGETDVVVRALGPSLGDKGVPNTLQDPTLDLYNSSGTKFASNDNWKDSQQTEIQNSGFAPSDDRESAILVQGITPGSYTAIVRGKNDTTGNALVEVYNP